MTHDDLVLNQEFASDISPQTHCFPFVNAAKERPSARQKSVHKRGVIVLQLCETFIWVFIFGVRHPMKFLSLSERSTEGNVITTVYKLIYHDYRSGVDLWHITN